MQKFTLISFAAAVATLFLITASAEQGANKEPATPATPTAAHATPATPATAHAATEAVAGTGTGKNSIMDQPVDFSSSGNVAKSLQAIEQQAGEKSAGMVNNAIQFMLVYDLSVGRNKDKLYKKLDGKTPNEILAMTKR